MEDTKRLLDWVRQIHLQMDLLEGSFQQARDLLVWIPAPADSVKDSLEAEFARCLKVLLDLRTNLTGPLTGPPSYPIRPLDGALIEMQEMQEQLQMARQRNHVLRERVLALTRELLGRDAQKADEQPSPKEQLSQLPE